MPKATEKRTDAQEEEIIEVENDEVETDPEATAQQTLWRHDTMYKDSMRPCRHYK